MAATMLGRSPSDEDLLNCSICLEPFRDPKTLPCLHSFCRHCLHDHYEALLRRQGAPHDSLSCPTCRESFTMPPSGVHGFRDDFKVPKVAEILRKTMAEKAERHLTGECYVCMQLGLITKATRFCTDCGLKFCLACVERHDDLKLFTGHSMLPIPERAASVPCAQHPTHFARYYCCDCAVLVCSVCILLTHRDHFLTDCQKLDLKKLEAFVKPLDAKIRTARKIVSTLQEYQSRGEASDKVSRAEILALKAQLVARVEGETATLLQELDASEKRKKVLFAAEMKKYQRCLRAWKDTTDMANGLLQEKENGGFFPGQHKLLSDLSTALRQPIPKYSKEVRNVLKFVADVTDWRLGTMEPVVMSTEDGGHDVTTSHGKDREAALHDLDHDHHQGETCHRGKWAWLRLGRGHHKKKKQDLLHGTDAIGNGSCGPSRDHSNQKKHEADATTGSVGVKSDGKRTALSTIATTRNGNVTSRREPDAGCQHRDCVQTTCPKDQEVTVAKIRRQSTPMSEVSLSRTFLSPRNSDGSVSTPWQEPCAGARGEVKARRVLYVNSFQDGNTNAGELCRERALLHEDLRKQVYETAPLTVETAPLAVETAPLAVETAPLAVETAPLAVETAPRAVETAPLAAETQLESKGGGGGGGTEKTAGPLEDQSEAKTSKPREIRGAPSEDKPELPKDTDLSKQATGRGLPKRGQAEPCEPTNLDRSQQESETDGHIGRSGHPGSDVDSVECISNETGSNVDNAECNSTGTGSDVGDGEMRGLYFTAPLPPPSGEYASGVSDGEASRIDQSDHATPCGSACDNIRGPVVTRKATDAGGSSLVEEATRRKGPDAADEVFTPDPQPQSLDLDLTGVSYRSLSDSEVFHTVEATPEVPHVEYFPRAMLSTLTQRMTSPGTLPQPSPPCEGSTLPRKLLVKSNRSRSPCQRSLSVPVSRPSTANSSKASGQGTGGAKSQTAVSNSNTQLRRQSSGCARHSGTSFPTLLLHELLGHFAQGNQRMRGSDNSLFGEASFWS